MADIDKLILLADVIAERAQLIMKRDRFLTPALFAFSTVDSAPTTIGLSFVSKDVIPLLLEEAARSTQGMILLMDMHGREIKPEEDSESINSPVKDHPDAITAIVVAVYMKDADAIKKIVYVEEGGEFSFMDMGWTRTTLKGRFENPYTTPKKNLSDFS